VIECVELSADLHDIDLNGFPTTAGTLADLMEKIGAEAESLQALPVAGRVAALKSGFVPLVRILAGGVAEFYARLETVINAGNDIGAGIRTIRETFVALSGRVGTIAADLSTGKEQAAMDSIKETAMALDSLLGLLHRVEAVWGVDYAAIEVAGRKLDIWMERLSRVGNEVIEAFDNKDTVLLGDLFEYELLEVVREVPAYLDALAAREPQEA
jgi:hypothetical protein